MFMSVVVIKFGPVLTYADISESAIVSFWIRLLPTRIQCIWHTNLQLFEYALQSGNFLIHFKSGIVWTLNS